jgi:4'-phosphopantetheinyl transferase
LGIDIEQIKNNNDSIAERFFTTSEYEDLKRLKEENRLYYFYDLWTLKESYIKCIGKGLHIPLNSFSFEIQNERVSLIPSDNSYNFRRYDCFSEYRVAVCAEEDNLSDVINPFEI